MQLNDVRLPKTFSFPPSFTHAYQKNYESRIKNFEEGFHDLIAFRPSRAL